MNKYIKNILTVCLVATLAIAISFPYRTQASISLIQTASGNGGNYVNTYNVAFGSNVTSGDLLVLSLTAGLGDTIGSISDTQSNGWTLASSTSSADRVTFLYYAANAHAGATTVTITFGSGQFNDSAAIIREYGGITTSSPLDRTAVGNDGTNYVQVHPTSPTGTTQQANELIVVAGGTSSNAPTYTVGTGYGNEKDQAGYDLYTSTFFEDQTVSSTGAYTGSFNTSSYVRGEAVIATFYASTVTPVSLPAHLVVSGGTLRISGGQLIVK